MNCRSFQPSLSVVATCLLLTFSASNHAAGSIGIMGALSESIYTDTDSDAQALPNISYEGERFYFKLPEIGYHVIPESKMQALSVGLSYQSAGFDPDDSDNSDIRLLDERDDSVMAFAEYRFGLLNTQIAQDISGEHDGYSVQLSIGLPLPSGNWVFIPSISHQYTSSQMSQHLYGVSQAESNRTSGRLSAYQTGSTSQNSIGLRSIYKASQQTNLMLAINHTVYSDSVFNSPIVDKRRKTSFLAGIIYNF
ncbi:MipA/OmpV family protein [Marinomonas sp. THO17]|uniref:MipA/OmpV family protein n=1 Tax=Marinomonas sp. THO17 TaxID=3149048 RepID=UPI00336C27F1